MGNVSSQGLTPWILEKMPRPAFSPVDVVGVGSVDVMHHLAQISSGGFNEQMIMIGHQDIAVEAVCVLFPRFLKIGFEPIVIRLGKKDPLALISATRDVIKSAFVLNPQRSRHEKPPI
jgi:hypothetical protein